MSFDNPMSRRTFLQTLTMVGAATVALPLLSHQSQAQNAGSAFAAGKTSDFKVGQYKHVTGPNGTTLYITKVMTGKKATYRALSSKCTHKGCEVLWMPDRNAFRCPCHGGMFDATGKNTFGPPPLPLSSYPTRVKQGVVYVQV